MLRSMLFGDICKQHLPMEKGKLSEWSKEPHSKCGVRITSYRGFESLTFRKRGTSKGVPFFVGYKVIFIPSSARRVSGNICCASARRGASDL